MMTVSKAVRLTMAGLCIAGLGAPVAYAEDSTLAADVIAVGPLELVETQSVTVLGRSYHTEDTSGLSTGAKVAIHGTLQPDGSAINVWVEDIGTYVAGSDKVYETGAVSDVNAQLGRLTISGSEVDYTNSLADPSAITPAVGAVVSVSGTQPVLGGVIVGDTTSAGSEQMRVAYFGGTRAAAVTGGNVSKAAVTGGNVSSAAVTGGNVSKTAVTGGNVSSAAVTGGNVSKTAVTGGNVSSAAVTGGNVSKTAVTGGNVSSAAVTGGNVSKTAVTGGNVQSAQ